MSEPETVAIRWYKGHMSNSSLLDYACDYAMENGSMAVVRNKVVSTLRAAGASRKIIYRARKILCDPALR